MAGIQHLAEAKLLHEIIGAAEQADRGHIAVDHMLHAAEQQAIGKGKVDLVGTEKRLQRLDRRIVAARLITNRNRHIGKVFRGPDIRIGRHENPAGRHRIGLAIQTSVT